MDIRNYFNKSAMSHMDSTFERSFIDQKMQQESVHNNVSDSDSAEEEKKRLEVRRKRKRRQKRKVKERTKSKTFNIIKAPLKERVTAENCPEILSVKDHIPTKETPAVIEAETKFFNQKNSTNTAHLMPQDFPYVRALLLKDQTCGLLREDREKLRASIEVVSRKYEEDRLREPIGSERPCIQGNECEGLKCSKIEDQNFILVEFLLPSEQAEYDRMGNYPQEQRMCLMCKRSHIARAFVNIRADSMGVREDAILQDYRNVVGIPGEYCLKDCIVTSKSIWEGLTDPVVLHVRTAYKYKEVDGVKHYEQWRMSYPSEDEHFLFQTPSL